MRLQFNKLIAWAAPCLPIAAVGLPMVVYLPPYYAGTLGLPLATVGFLFLLVRFIDVPIDLFIGTLIDNTRSRFGRFRPWLVAGSLIMSVGVWGLFFAEPGVSAPVTFAWLLLLYLGWSAMYLAQTSWGATLSEDYAERARIFGWWTAMNIVGTLLMLIIPPVVARAIPGEGEAPGIHAMGWFVIALLPTTAILAAVITGHTGRPITTPHVRWRDVTAIVKDRRMARLLIADALVNMAPGVTGALFLFFFTRVGLYSPAEASTLLLFYFAGGLLAAGLWTRFAQSRGKHIALTAAAAWYAVTQFGVVVLPPNSYAIAAVAMFIAGVPAAAPAFLLRAMLADLTDAQRLDSASSTDTTGTAYAVLTVTQKLAYGVPVGLTYPVLGAIGFNAAPGAANSDSALLGLTLLFTIPPAILAVGAGIAAWGWPITATEHARVRAALDARDAATPA
jgi:Na+/melibiose symporter-like transporter